MEGLRELSIQRGAADAKLIRAKGVEVAEWVLWKCRFGCPHYGRNLTCPPHSPTPQQTRMLLEGYSHALLLRYQSSQDHHGLLLEMEREAFLSGFHKALGLGAGRCRLCETCQPGGACTQPAHARPSMEACGIDVFATARNAGFEMRVLASKEASYPRYCLLLLT